LQQAIQKSLYNKNSINNKKTFQVQVLINLKLNLNKIKIKKNKLPKFIKDLITIKFIRILNLSLII